MNKVSKLNIAQTEHRVDFDCVRKNTRRAQTLDERLLDEKCAVVLVNCIQKLRVRSSNDRRTRDCFYTYVTVTTKFLRNPFKIKRAASTVAFETYFSILYAWDDIDIGSVETRNKNGTFQIGNSDWKKPSCERKIDENKIFRNGTKLPKLMIRLIRTLWPAKIKMVSKTRFPTQHFVLTASCISTFEKYEKPV